LIQAERNEETNTLVSILPHTGITLNKSVINHSMVITNVEKLTRLRFCSKCGLGFTTSDTHRARFNKHCEECDGKFHKKLKLNSSLAFVPRIIKNKAL
jgi:transcriptional regulator NrdR family protein